MMAIVLTAYPSSLEVTQGEHILEGGIRNYDVEFRFPENDTTWSDMALVACFETDLGTWAAFLDLETKSCKIPWEALDEGSAGSNLSIGLYGVMEDDNSVIVRSTVWAAMPFRILPGPDAEPAQEPSPSVVQATLGEVSKVVQRMTAIQEIERSVNAQAAATLKYRTEAEKSASEVRVLLNAANAAESARNVWTEYMDTSIYAPGNKVSYNGSCYVCITPCAGVEPTADGADRYWLLIAKRGDDGPTGKDGDTPWIGDNGNWWVGTVDTGVAADGSASEAGVGKATEGTVYTIDGVEVTAAAGAEVFNDTENNIATGLYSHVEGETTIATGEGAHAEGISSKASGRAAHAEGENTAAAGTNSHAEGYGTKASNIASHAEGYFTTAKNRAAHAEGYGSTASGAYGSHAEGQSTQAVGDNGSHTEGYGTVARSNSQHAQGKFNVMDAENRYAHIVGNGTSDTARSNAHTLDWDGNAWFAGDVVLGGTDQDDESAVWVLKRLKDLGSRKEIVQAAYNNLLVQTNWQATKTLADGNVDVIPKHGVPFTSSMTTITNYIGDLDPGVSYTVEWNGTVYECICYNGTDDNVCLGNGSLAGESGGNSEPFCIVWYPETSYMTICKETTDTETVVLWVYYTGASYEYSELPIGHLPMDEITNVVAASLGTSAGGSGSGLVSIVQTTESAVDGGTNVITATFEDGSTSIFRIKNGSKGSTGATGQDGTPGADGKDGVGITSVEQTTTSDADGGTNEITMTLSDGTIITFSVKNGSKGSTGAAGQDGDTPYIGENNNWWIADEDTGVLAQGANGVTPHIGANGNWYIGANNTGVKATGEDGENGEDGYTPVKGTDYWTDADQEAIVDDLIERTEWQATKSIVSGGEEVVPESDVNFTSEFAALTNFSGGLEAGTSYIVEWNGVEYTCTCHSGDGLYLGNGTLAGESESNNEPFCILWYSGATLINVFKKSSTAETITVKVITEAEYEYNALPKEYLPMDDIISAVQAALGTWEGGSY